MSRTPPKYVLWRYEDPFRKCTEAAAREVFGLLDRDLRPRVFFVGFDCSRRPFRCAGVAPEGCGYGPEVFPGEQLDINDLRVMLPTGTNFPSWIGGMPHISLSLSWQVSEFLRAHPESRGWHSCCSAAVKVGGNLVCAVLQLDSAVLASYPRLESSTESDAPGEPSLIDAVATEFLETCAQELSVDEPGRSFRTWRRDPAEIVRGGGRRLMTSPIAAADQDRDPSGLFNNIDVLSSLPYEGEAGTGGLVLARREHDDLSIAVSFREGVALDDHRGVRKILQLSASNLFLLSDASACYGLGTVSAKYAPEREDLFVVSFVKHHTWQLRHNDAVLMQVAYGMPALLRPEFPEAALAAALTRFFGTSPEQARPLLDVAKLVASVQHGSVVVIARNAADEAARLAACNQATAIDPRRLPEDVLRRLPQIDGAVLLDPEGACHAIGVILDGRATKRGVRARGARFNSAIRYVESRADPAVIVVKSEDGMVDIITKATCTTA